MNPTSTAVLHLLSLADEADANALRAAVAGDTKEAERQISTRNALDAAAAIVCTLRKQGVRANNNTEPR